MHYEKAPRYRRSKPDEAPPPLRCAVQGFGPLRRRLGVTGVDLRWERTTGEPRQISWRMALYLRGKDKRWHESRAGVAPAEVQRLLTAHCYANHAGPEMRCEAQRVGVECRPTRLGPRFIQSGRISAPLPPSSLLQSRRTANSASRKNSRSANRVRNT
jgi:hypothetical protein